MGTTRSRLRLESGSTNQQVRWRSELASALGRGQTQLSLIGRNVGAEGAQHIAEALLGNRMLKELYLDSNSIGPDGALHIAEAVKRNPTLRVLHLRNNAIGAEGAHHLAEALREDPPLQKLVLDCNGVGPEGAAHLADALRENKRLRELDLRGNSLGDQGAMHFAEVLRENRKLRELYLFDNDIGDEGVRHLADALRENRTLHKLGLHGNNVGTEGARYLAEALQEKKVRPPASSGSNVSSWATSSSSASISAGTPPMTPGVHKGTTSELSLGFSTSSLRSTQPPSSISPSRRTSMDLHDLGRTSQESISEEQLAAEDRDRIRSFGHMSSSITEEVTEEELTQNHGR